MSQTKTISTRVQHKREYQKDWEAATNFTPLEGELIVYKPDTDTKLPTEKQGSHSKARIKIGDGTTNVNALPFIVDKEEVDTAVAALQTTFSNVSVTGRDITFTTVGGDTKTITTQDTNSDVNVTTTPEPTSKAFITGTKIGDTTGPLVYDPNVYLDTISGVLAATSFKGTATKATSDANGNNIVNTYATKSAVSADIAAATSNMNKEAYLSWGGKNISGGVGPLGASLSSELSANRIAFINPNALSFRTSINGGNTWSNLTVSDTDKINLVTDTAAIPAIAIGSGTPVTTSHKTEIVLAANSSTTRFVYTRPKKLLINLSSPHTVKVDISYKTGESGATYQQLLSTNIGGWPGWNDLDLSAISTFGGDLNSQKSNVWYLKLEFYYTAVSDNYKNSLSTILGIRLFGDASWYPASMLGTNGHLYSFDSNKNATFPAEVTATKFNGQATALADNFDLGSARQPVWFEEGVLRQAVNIPQIHTGLEAPSNDLGENGDIYVMPYTYKLPAIHSGTAVPDHTIGVNGDIYIMY